MSYLRKSWGSYKSTGRLEAVVRVWTWRITEKAAVPWGPLFIHRAGRESTQTSAASAASAAPSAFPAWLTQAISLIPGQVRACESLRTENEREMKARTVLESPGTVGFPGHLSSNRSACQ